MDGALINDAKANVQTVVAISTAMLGAIMFGMDQGNFGNVQNFKSFRDAWCVGNYEMPLVPDSCGDGASDNSLWNESFIRWGVTYIGLGAALGGLLLGPPITGRLGRRPCISIGAFLTFVGCLLATVLSFESVTLFMLGRVLTGFGVGVCCFALPMYNSEMATPGIRGITGSLFQFNVVLGSFIATILTLVNSNWKVGMMLPGIAGIIVSALVWITPESPRFVMQKSGYEAGVAILQKVRSGSVEQEAREIQQAMEDEKEAGEVTYKQMFVTDANLRKRLLIAVWLQIAQQLTGVNAFLGYAGTLFAQMGVTNEIGFNVIWNGVMIVGCVAGIAFIDSSMGGRRIQLLVATFGMGPFLLLAGAALQFGWPGFIAMVSVCVYGFFFQFAWGMIPWVYPSEIFSMAEKDKAMSFAVFFQYGINAAIYFITPVLMDWWISGTMYTFGILNCLNFVFVLACIKETKGVPLEKIPALFGQVGLGASLSNA